MLADRSGGRGQGAGMTGEDGVRQNGAKMPRIINVHVVVADAARLYFDYLIRNFRHSAKDPSRLFFFCYSLDQQTQAAFAGDPRLSGCYPVYEMRGAYRLKTLHEWKVYLRAKLTGRAALGGSNGHAAGLNRIMQAMPTMAGHHVIADSDVAMLTRDWDEAVCNLLKTYDIVGTNYEEEGGFTSGKGKNQTFKRLPNAVWIAIRQECDLEGMDWMPSKETNLAIDTHELSETYNLPLGYELVRDIGWRLPALIRERGYKSKATTYVGPTSSEVQVLHTGNDYNQEYHLGGKVFVGHQRGGSRNEFRQTALSIAFYNCVEDAVGAPD